MSRGLKTQRRRSDCVRTILIAKSQSSWGMLGAGMDLWQMFLDRPESMLPNDEAGVSILDDFAHLTACIFSEGPALCGAM